MSSIHEHGKRWGRWQYNKEQLILDYLDPRKGGKSRYYVDLERCRTGAQILDWILQIAGKDWASNEDIGNLVRALDRLGNGLQGKVCPVGRNKRFDFKKHLVGSRKK